MAPTIIDDAAAAQARRVAAGVDCEITSDGRTVWVNSREGWCIGRFCHFGVDVHTVVEPGQFNQGCLDCTDVPDWYRFKYSMLKFYGVDLPDRYMPDFLKKVSTT